MTLDTLLQEIDILKSEYKQLQSIHNPKIQDALAIEYTYESNRIEGNTLTLQETQLVIEKGLTISGKSLREHLEAINHKEAIDFMTDIVKHNEPFNERNLLQIHSIILKSIDKENAGIYRKVPVLISGSTHTPPQPYLVAKLMEDYFIFYEENKESLHPVILSAEMHERLVTIHPFIDGNGRTSRLVMNLILLQNGFPIANIKGDFESRMNYYNALEYSRGDEKMAFNVLIAGLVKESLERMIGLAG
ncbi:MAG: Fic family protein [Chitinophagales bacterium]|jgi:Fic family protein|nr:Fic family protein [Chitinophagales bacterium]